MSEILSALVVVVMVLVVTMVAGLIVTMVGLASFVAVVVVISTGVVGLVLAEENDSPVKLSGVRTMTTESRSDDREEARDYRGIMLDLATQDQVGSYAKTQIRVVAIRDARGDAISWRIQLPSTQNWELGNVDGALNDARADVVVALFPGASTQYESAVWDAMDDAGALDDDAPIMFSGWSLGGMIAADLAMDERVAGRVETVFTAGSAIDKYYSDMPEGVRVIQINNAIDPVHVLEPVGFDPVDILRTDADWETYRALAWPIHDAGMYGAEAERLLPEPRPGDEKFFAVSGAESYEDTYIAEYARGS